MSFNNSSKIPKMLALAALLSLAPSWRGAVLMAGDHTDSPLTRGNQAADLADVYVFPIASTNGGTRLVMVMTAHPYASPPRPPDPLVPSKRPGTQFSDAVDYVFRLRPAQIEGSGPATQIATDGERELEIVCRFDDAIYQGVTCASRTQAPDSEDPVVLEAHADVDVVGGGETDEFRVFAGCRADPFFTDPGKLLYNYLKLPQLFTPVVREWAVEKVSGGTFLGRLFSFKRVGALERILAKVPEQPEFEVIQRPRDRAIDWWSWDDFIKAAVADRAQWVPLPTPFIRHSNVLAIVVELELEKAYGGALGSDLFALAGETRKGERRIDRDARPATNNLLFAKSVPYVIADDSIPEIVKLQDLWNQEDTFALDEENAVRYAEALQVGMSLYDSADGGVDWPTPNPMLPVIMTDVLLFDVSSANPPSSTVRTYFEIEMSHFQGKSHTTFGGRALNEDSIDTFLTWFINGPDRYDQPRRTDGENEPSRPATDEFPYLREPHLTLPNL